MGREAGWRIWIAAAVMLFAPSGVFAVTNSEAQSQLSQVEELLTGANKETAKAQEILLKFVEDPNVDADQQQLAYVYLGYIEDNARERLKSKKWFEKACAVEGMSDTSAYTIANAGLSRAIISIKELDGKRRVGVMPPQRINIKAKDSSPGACFDAVWEAYDKYYAGFVLSPEVNWNRSRQVYREKAARAKTPEEFAEIVATMLKQFQDLHIWVYVKDKQLTVFKRPRRFNFNPQARESLIGKIETLGSIVKWGRTEDGIGYIAIDTWASQDNIAADFDSALEKLDSCKCLILDVRANGGGSDFKAAEVAGRFTDKEVTFAYQQFRNGPDHNDLTKKMGRNLKPRGKTYTKPVLVLIGLRCMSANDSFAAMMKECGYNVKLMGERTFGSSGRPRFLDLPNGVKVSVPTWLALLPDGKPLDGRGVEPDIKVMPPPEGFRGKQDAVLTAALARFRREPASKLE